MRANVMRFDVLTLFPGMFPSYLGQSLLKLAIDAGLIDVQLHNIRDSATTSTTRWTTARLAAARAWC